MAEKELAKARSKFVGKVSKDMIKQLLDHLLEVEVLNEGEKDSILEENTSRADRARVVIDTVKRKGDTASRKMIDFLQSRDQTLYSELGLSCGLPEAQIIGDELSKKQDDIYPVTNNSIKNRLALLITNITFNDERFNRKGAEIDEKNMEKLLTDQRYEVVKHTNLTAKEIDVALIEFSKHPKLRETDSVLVVIMSHGKLGFIHGVDYNDDKPADFPINNIYKHLGSEKCPALLNKPKIIIIQACRGDKGGAVLVSDSPALVCDDVQEQGPPVSAGEGHIVDDNLRYVHKEKDFISLLSSTPDAVSYRRTDRGSFLIQHMVDVFTKFARKDDIEELFRKVMKHFEDMYASNIKQMPTKDRCTLTKKFYFFPGL